MPAPRHWLRVGILAATLLPLISIALIAGFSKAQPPGPPGQRNNPGGSSFPGSNPNFPNMPNNPRMPGGNPNFPGNAPPSFPGGSSPNAPGNSPPSFPGGMPNNPNSPGPNMPSMPGPPEMVWTCSACGKEVGRGPFKPDLANCPFCGVRISNTPAGMQAGAQDHANNMTNRPSGPSYGGPSSPAGPVSSSAAPRVAAAFWIMALVVIGVIVVIIAVAIGGAVMLFNSSPKPRRVSRSRRYRDDY